MEPLTFDQILPALPPKEHGGSIDVLKWTKGRTRSFLLHPEDCLVADEGQILPKLQAKVHILGDDKMLVANLLVERHICDWIELDSVIQFKGERVLNGMFGVAKTATLADNRPHLRVIMNLIPSNSILMQLSGCVQELPAVTQYLSLVLEDTESLRLCQNDMTSAFYLFSLPRVWLRFLSFNLVVSGKEIGRDPQKKFCLACGVLPMGWSSAVSVMQEISQLLVESVKLPQPLQVKRDRPLPVWLCKVLEDSQEKGCPWFHVYLDNFFSGERLVEGACDGEAKGLQELAEEAWNAAGVLSAEKKKVVNSEEAQELGALFSGRSRSLGVSGLRMVKLLQTTFLLLSKHTVPRKWLQVAVGRWVHVLQFRRAGMAGLHWIWKWISGKRLTMRQQCSARQELLMLVMGGCLFHSFLGAQISDVATASDASGTGGAVGQARELSQEGKDFARSILDERAAPVKVPILVVSLFNGIGGAFRCYDIIGVEPAGLVSFDTCKAANRVTARRWPQAIIKEDVRDIDLKMVREWMLLYPHIEQLDFWAGFPCVDLSKVKAFRQNLHGEQSGLFREVLRVLELLRQVFGRKFKVFFFVENVSSMDKEAAAEISQSLGVFPYKVQCSDAVPISRPRFCWTNREVSGLAGVRVVRKEGFWEIIAEAPYPLLHQWIREDSEWPGHEQGHVLPTCMKAIRRSRPPPLPAGLDRTPSAAQRRWAADNFKYPPYQYKDQYVFWSAHGWRLAEASERELLHGYGWGHTAVCFSASEIKKSWTAYEDQRCSLIGDSFSVYSFIIFAWSSCARFLPSLSYETLANRMGLAPGSSASLDVVCPLARKLSYGHPEGMGVTVSDLTRVLLTRVNRTGSDVRVTTGRVLNPRAFPRQSASADWWQWKSVFSCRWARKEHINLLEMRSILLSFRWRIRHLAEVDCRFIHLTDSYVSMSIISKGRSSSDMIMHVMRQIAATQFAFNLFPILIHVESTENPTDTASRT